LFGGLVSSGHIAPAPGGATDQVTFALTLRGQAAVRESAEVVPEERQVSVAFDGLLRRYCLIDEAQRWRPRDIRDAGILEVPAFPVDPPEPGPKDTNEVGTLIAAGLAEKEGELLAVLGMAGRRHKFFLRGLALVFQPADRAGDASINFLIDGRPSPAHDQAFAAAEGRRKLGLLSQLENDGLESSQRLVSRELVANLPDPQEIATLRRVTEEMRDQYSKLRDQDSVNDSGDIAQTSALEESAARLETAESALERLPVRILEVHEHPDYLRDALANTQHRLLIVSPWIRAEIVNNDFLGRLEALLKSGANVCIAHGIDDGARTRERDRHAETRLARLAEKYTNFIFARLGDTHAKVLVVDRRHVIVTSFNWLSYKGDPNRPFRDERGTLVTVGEEIERLYDHYIARVATA